MVLQELGCGFCFGESIWEPASVDRLGGVVPGGIPLLAGPLLEDSELEVGLDLDDVVDGWHHSETTLHDSVLALGDMIQGQDLQIDREELLELPELLAERAGALAALLQEPLALRLDVPEFVVEAP